LIERLKLIIVVIVSCGLSLLDLLLLHHCPHIGDMHAVADAAMWIFEVLQIHLLKILVSPSPSWKSHQIH
jgi:hypothetical protein